MPKPECLTCGACCISPIDQQSFCDVTEADEKLLGKELVRRYVYRPSIFDSLLMQLDHHPHPAGALKTVWMKEKSGPFKSYQFCRCIFLQGAVMKKVKCRIYEKRPRVCHMAMKPGDQACKQLRQCFQESMDELQDSPAPRSRRSTRGRDLPKEPGRKRATR